VIGRALRPYDATTGLAKTFGGAYSLGVANIIRLDKFGHPCARGILDHVAGVEDLFLAKATYDAACKRWHAAAMLRPTR
jgi:hypothetical protein